MTDETGAGEGAGDFFPPGTPPPAVPPAGNPPSSNPPSADAPGWSWGPEPAAEAPTPTGPPAEPPTMLGGAGPVVPGPYEPPPPDPGAFGAPPGPGGYSPPPGPGAFGPPPGGFGGPPPQQYGAQPWGPPASSPYGVVPASAPTDGLAIASLITGVVSMVAAFLCCLGGFIGIGAVVMGVMSRKRIGQSNGASSGNGLAVGGIVTGAIGLVIALLTLAFFGFLFTVGSASSSGG